MPSKPKSIFRQPGATHFQVVHRSQRDPLIHDPDAPQHVLKPFVRENDKKGKSRSDLEQILSPEETLLARSNIGQAASHGVYYDDTEYDYMQHLKPLGLHEEGVESILIEAPTKQKKEKPTGIQLKDLPENVLASTSELPRNYENQQAIPESIAGFNPDMDPHLRQTLEALEDDAFVDDNIDIGGDNFFAELVTEGERGGEEELDFEFSEWGVQVGSEGDDLDPSEHTWEQQFAKFKKEQKNQASSSHGSDDDLGNSEGGDTLSGLPAISVIGGSKRRRQKRASSDASGYSMSSSSLFRNEHLQTLDEAFDQVMLKEYADEEDDDTPDEQDFDDSGSDDSAPELITSREDFDEMVTTFLTDFEILGRKLKPKLEGDTGSEKLDTLRRAMGIDARVLKSLDVNSDDSEEEEVSEEEKDKWDCETILTTYSNLENHPRLIRARDNKPIPKIIIDPRTGLPQVESPARQVSSQRNVVRITSIGNTDDNDDASTIGERREPIARPRNESKEDKKARKASVKEERASRRVEKRQKKEIFGSEMKKAKAQDGGTMVQMRKL